MGCIIIDDHCRCFCKHRKIRTNGSLFFNLRHCFPQSVARMNFFMHCLGFASESEDIHFVGDAGHVSQVEKPGSFFTGRLADSFASVERVGDPGLCSLEVLLGLTSADEEQGWDGGRVGKTRYVVCKDENGQIRAFHNVCRHHAAAVASGSGCTRSFVCPYHVRRSSSFPFCDVFAISKFILRAILWKPSISRF